MNKMEFKKGDEVYIKGVVINTEGYLTTHPLDVEFSWGRNTFTNDGKFNIDSEYISLFHFPPTKGL